VDFLSLKARYNAAFDAYHEIARQNAQRSLTGENPSTTDVQREQSALGVLEEARGALLAALALPANLVR
jgi:hypothetical protein